MQAVVGASGGQFSRDIALGSLSLILWVLLITISVKYCLFVMRADNRWEDGILAWSPNLLSQLGRIAIQEEGQSGPSIVA